jgi:hypothetical protein
MGANAEATTLKGRPRAHRGERLVASQRKERSDQDAVEIGTLYRKGRKAILDSVNYQLQAGRKLIQKKHSMPHGEWLAWLRANADALGFQHRATASRLMKAAATKGASTHPLDEAEAIQISRTLWGNPAAATVPKAQFEETEAKKKRLPKNRRRPRSRTTASRPCLPL